jgi:hypothetical protein
MPPFRRSPELSDAAFELERLDAAFELERWGAAFELERGDAAFELERRELALAPDAFVPVDLLAGAFELRFASAI